MNKLTDNRGLFINDLILIDDKTYGKCHIKTYYVLHIVTEGAGRLLSTHVGYDISRGDIFLTLPHQGYTIENINNLSVIAIEFTGMRAVELAKALLDNVMTPVFNEYEDFISIWEFSLKNFQKTNNPLVAEGLLLCTLGSIPGKGILKGGYKKRESIMLQTYIRSNFNNHNLSLESVANTFGYNKKYLSDLFKRKFDISFTDFLRKVRLENACSLMQLGQTSVSKISAICGFNDPLYFSKLFKEEYGMSPKAYINSLKS